VVGLSTSYGLGWGSLAMVSPYGRHVPQNAGDLARETINAMLSEVSGAG